MEAVAQQAHKDDVTQLVAELPSRVIVSLDHFSTEERAAVRAEAFARRGRGDTHARLGAVLSLARDARCARHRSPRGRRPGYGRRGGMAGKVGPLKTSE